MAKKNRPFYLSWFLLLLLIFSTGWFFMAKFYDQQVLSQQSRSLEEKAQLFLQFSDQKIVDLEKIIESPSFDLEERLTGLDADGNILFDTYNPNLHGQRSNRPEIKAVLKNQKLGRSLRASDTVHTEMLYVALPVKIDNQLVGILRIAEPTQAFWPESIQMKRAIFLVYFLLCCSFSFALFKIIRQRNHPIETILPVLKRMIEEPEHAETIISNSTQWNELYQSVNQLSEGVSQRYQTYQATEKQFYFLLEELTIGVFLLDESHQITFMNQAMKEQLSYYLDFPEQAAFDSVVSEAALIQMVYQLSDSVPFIHREIITHSDNKRLDVSLSYFNETKQILGVSYDFTRIHQLEKMQKDFVGNVSHELKTPITSLIGFTETLLDGAKEDPDTLTAFLEIMQKEAYRLEKLTQEIIELSKGEDISYPVESINVYDFFAQLRSGYQTIIAEKNIDLVLTGPSDYLFETQMALFYPICKNLLENALYYSLPDGKVHIDFLPNEGLTITIQDFGIGISPEDIERIYERFYRVDKARTRNTGGSGIGLAIVKNSVERLGGSIVLDSHLGIGTTFTVHLPLLPESNK